MVQGYLSTYFFRVSGFGWSHTLPNLSIHTCTYIHTHSYYVYTPDFIYSSIYLFISCYIIQSHDLLQLFVQYSVPTYISLYIYTHRALHVCIHIYIYTCVYTHKRYIYIYIHTYIHIERNTCTHVCMSVYVRVHIICQRCVLKPSHKSGFVSTVQGVARSCLSSCGSSGSCIQGCTSTSQLRASSAWIQCVGVWGFRGLELQGVTGFGVQELLL